MDGFFGRGVGKERRAERPLDLEITGLPGGEKSAPWWVRFRVADDNVIQQFDFENFGRLPRPAGYEGDSAT